MGTENKKNTWSLVAGLLFIAIGTYRIYSHFLKDEISYGNFRLLLAVAFIGYGFYRLYGYFNTNNE